MKFVCTRDKDEEVISIEAVVKGISKTGGLYVPTGFPKVDLDEIIMMNSYKEVAKRIISLFFDELSEEDVELCIENSYGRRFKDSEVAPLEILDGFSVMELFHGPTLAFKDMALTFMPHLMKISMEKMGVDKKVLILTATSGDTGKAALEGFKDVENIEIIVFYPENGVSDIQKLQMKTQEGKNVKVVGINGNFDDAQTGVKEVFNDKEFNEFCLGEGYVLSSANSINIGRLIPQIIYYFNAYRLLVTKGVIERNEEVNFSVPTGNFGNILAGYYTKLLGLPINKLICASNENNVLYDFFSEGKYDKNRELKLTSSPSMDILISSNLERLLFEITYRDDEVVNKLMSDLKNKGVYSITDEMKVGLESFASYYSTESEVKKAIKKCFDENKYVIDTHTASAYDAFIKNQKEDDHYTIVLSTASPFKFSKDVLGALTGEDMNGVDAFKANARLSEEYDLFIPSELVELGEKDILHNNTIEKDEIMSFCKSYVEGNDND